MFKALVDKTRTMDKDFLLFLVTGMFLGIAQSVDGSTMSNYLKDRFDMLILQRSALEIPREMPGFLVFIVIGFLFSLGDVRIAALANMCAAIGMFLLGVIPSNYTLVIIVIFIYSMGIHVYIPLSNSIAMSFANDGRLGRKLGQVNAVNTAALVAGSVVLWLLFRFVKISFFVSFSIGAAALLIASAMLFLINPMQTVKMNNRFIFRKEYGLYYWLSVLYGARKQIFITFAPWVIVDVFKQKVTTMTALFFAISILSIFVRPLIGYMIDKIGERFVLSSEAGILFFVCLGYSFAEDIFSKGIAVIVVCACYILDQALNAVSMARATYLKKIAVAEEDVSPTLSLGISIDHIVSMFLPSLGGYIWYSGGTSGYKYVFLGGALIAIVNLISAMRIKIPDIKSFASKTAEYQKEI